MSILKKAFFCAVCSVASGVCAVAEEKELGDGAETDSSLPQAQKEEPTSSDSESVPAGSSDAEETEKRPPTGQIYTPVRAAVHIQEHLLTPFYAFYGQLLPTSISTGGKIASSTYGTGCSWRYVRPDKTRLALSNFNYRRTDYRFSGHHEPAPFEHTDSLRAMTYHEFINPEYGCALATILSASLAADDHTDLNDGFGWLVAVAYKQYFSEETSCMLGFSVAYNAARERCMYLPVFSIDYRFSPHFNLRVLNGMELTWDISGKNEFLVDFSVLYEGTAFAVGRENDATSRYYGEKGVYSMQSVPVTLSGTWNVSKNFFINVQTSLITWAKYRLYRDGGKTSEKFSTDPGVSFAVQAGFRF